MSWTDERIATLRELWDRGLTASQIAEAIGGGMSRNAVIGKAHRLGLKSRPSPLRSAEAPKVETAETMPPQTSPEPARAESPQAPPKPQPAPRPAQTAKPAKTTLLELNDRVCKWPIGHPDEADFHFCGKPSQAGFPYCTEHCAVAYQAQLPRRDRPRPLPPMLPRVR